MILINKDQLLSNMNNKKLNSNRYFWIKRKLWKSKINRQKISYKII